MSEPIKLKVPAEPASEFVSQGNFHAELVPNSTIETKSREFADWLLLSVGLTEIKPKTKPEEDEQVNEFVASYPADFPGRDALIKAEIPLATVEGLTRKQLLKVPGIGAATADAIAGYKPAPLILPPAIIDADVETEGNEAGNKTDDETDESGDNASADTDGGAK